MSWIAKELARATRSRFAEVSEVNVYIWRSPSGRWFALAPGKLGASGDSRAETVREALEQSPKAPLKFIDSVAPGVSR